MAEPTTVNGGLIVPNTGDLVGTWGSAALNPDFVALDGVLWGVQTISASNAPIVLTSPAGFTPTPSGGPTQAQNAVLRFTGSLSAPVQVTLPLPGFYIVENLTTGNFVLTFRAAGSGSIIAVDQGEILHIENDGTNVKFVNLGRIGHTEIWAGLSAMPAWVTACTNVPYLLCDGTVYNVSAFPYLGSRLGSKFGGNGISTFGVPDLQGRAQLPYDGTGTRITTAGCGINGQTLGASGGAQDVTMLRSDMPNVDVTVNIHDPGHTHPINPTGLGTFGGNAPQTGSGGGTALGAFTAVSNTTGITSDFQLNGAVTQTSQNNVPPAQVTGIAVIRAA